MATVLVGVDAGQAPVTFVAPRARYEMWSLTRELRSETNTALYKAGGLNLEATQTAAEETPYKWRAGLQKHAKPEAVDCAPRRRLT